MASDKILRWVHGKKFKILIYIFFYKLIKELLFLSNGNKIVVINILLITHSQCDMFDVWQHMMMMRTDMCTCAPPVTWSPCSPAVETLLRGRQCVFFKFIFKFTVRPYKSLPSVSNIPSAGCVTCAMHRARGARRPSCTTASLESCCLGDHGSLTFFCLCAVVLL